MDQVEGQNHRQLKIARALYAIWAVLGLVVVLLLCWIALNGLRVSTPAPIVVGAVSDFALDSITLQFVNADFFDPLINKSVATLPLEVVRDGQGNFTIYYARSTNPPEGALIPRQCVVEWEPSLETFLELCGGSQWTRDGKYHSGPAPRSLDRFPVEIKDGKVYIDLKLVQGPPHT